MEPKNAAQEIIEGKGALKSQRRLSFSPIRSPINRAFRTLSIGSLGSQLSNASDTEIVSPNSARRRSTLRKLRPTDNSQQDLTRQLSKASSDDYTEWTSISTRPTSASGTGSQGTSISGEFRAVIKSGPLQEEPSILKTGKKEYLVLTQVALMKFKNRLAAIEQFPQISVPTSAVEALSPVDSLSSFKGFDIEAEVHIPLEKVVAVFRNEGTKPSFSLEIWWKDPQGCSFANLELDFTLPEDRNDWLKHIEHTIKQRTRAISEERIPSNVEVDLAHILEARYPHQKNTHLDIFPVVPRRPYSRLRSNSGEVKKGWRDGSSFYLAFSKYFCLLAQFTKSPTGQRVNPNLVQFGLVTLSKVNGRLDDERFDLIFRLPLDKPKKLELATIHHRNIIARLFKADTYLKPAWPIWTRREVFYIDGESQQIPLPEGEDYGGFKRTLEAFLEGYHSSSVNWKVTWRDVKHAPEFRLLSPLREARYTNNQLLAVFRSLRFNDFFKSLSFRDIDFSALSETFDNTERMEPTAWLSRTGKRSLTRDEFEVLENSSVLFQEVVALLLGSESVKHVDLGGVLNRVPVESSGAIQTNNQSCEVIPPLVFLLTSMQTRCKNIFLNGNSLTTIDVSELSQTLQTRPRLVRGLGFSQCRLDETAMISLWEGIHEQRRSLEVLELANNSSRLEASRVSQTLQEASKIRQLDLAYCLKGNVNGPLLRPWTSSPYTDPWRLQQVNLSGWKINFDSVSAFLRYLELDESSGLRKLVLNNCGLSGEIATAIFCRIGKGRDMHLYLNDNPLEEASIDWIDLIHGDESPQKLHLDMIQFKHESNFNRLLTALTYNTTIKFLSLVGTGPPARASSKTSELLTKLFETNSTLQFLDLSGYSGKLEDGHMGWGLSGALVGLKQNQSLRQLRIRNHDIGAAEDVTELCRVIATNQGLAMFDIQSNNFNHHQFSKLVHALNFNHQIISFPMTNSDRDYALGEEKRIFIRHLKPTKGPQKFLSKNDQGRLDGLLKWLEGHWESEADKVEATLQRNREYPINQLLELDAEYLEAWDDEKLPSWLVAKPSANPSARDEGKGKDKVALNPSIETPKSNPLVMHSFPSPDSAALDRSFSPSRTYTIEEEESSTSEYAPSPPVESSDHTTPQDDGNGTHRSSASTNSVVLGEDGGYQQEQGG